VAAHVKVTMSFVGKQTVTRMKLSKIQALDLKMSQICLNTIGVLPWKLIE
jgi:hypothetical protein